MENQLKATIEELKTRLNTVRVSDMMTRSVVTTTPQVHLADLADQMIKDRISGLPVIGKEGKMIGVVTTTDLLIVMGMMLERTAMEQKASSVNPTVDFAMSTDIISVTEDTTLDEVVRLMRTKSVHTIPVVRGDQIVGVVGRHDVLKKFYEAVKDLSA